MQTTDGFGLYSKLKLYEFPSSTKWLTTSRVAQSIKVYTGPLSQVSVTARMSIFSSITKSFS